DGIRDYKVTGVQTCALPIYTLRSLGRPSTVVTQQIVEQQQLKGGLAIAAYPSESETWKSSAVDGVEIYNLFTNARQINSAVMFLDRKSVVQGNSRDHGTTHT